MPVPDLSGVYNRSVGEDGHGSIECQCATCLESAAAASAMMATMAYEGSNDGQASQSLELYELLGPVSSLPC